MKKITLLFIFLLSVLNISAEVYSGSCGDNVSYTLDTSTGVLSITGTGAMTDYRSSSDIPWFSYKSYIKAVEIADGVTSIGIYAFSACSNLTSVTIGNSVKSIRSTAFSGCTKLITITIPNSVTSIGKGAFEGCKNLTSVTIPNSVTSIGSSAFRNSSSLTSVTIPNSVTSIGGNSFNGCSGLTSIEIPNSVTSIGDEAFSGCSSLTSIEIPNSVTTIGESSFSDCSSLTEVLIPNSVTRIGNYAFSGCSGLKSVTISNGVLSIGNSAFKGCSGLTSIEIPNSVTSIGEYAFSGCSGLNLISVESGNIKYDSRDNCNAIIETATNTLVAGCKNTIIPNSVTSIGSSAFYGCSSLTSITIPNSVTSIGNYAFSSCFSLKDFYCYANNVPTTSSYAFYNSPITSATLHVPATALEAYKTTKPWSGFGKIVAAGDEPVVESIAISETNFPDENFRNWILSQDYGKDGVLTEAEIADVTYIDVSDKSIQSLKGIEYFTALTELNCSGNQLTSLYMTKNITLKTLYCYNNQLTSLDVSNNTTLTTLTCLGNQLKSLDVSKNTELTYLYCSSNQLTSLDVSKNTKLTNLSCENNNLTSLDVSKNTALGDLYCYSNQIYGTAMDALVASLPNVKKGKMYIINNKNEENVMTTAQVTATQAKGWSPQYFDGKYWKDYSGSELAPDEKCATPTISFVGGKIVFDCETEGVEFVSEVTCSDSGKYNSGEIPVTSTYTVSVYAKKDGYENSDVVTKEINVGGTMGIKGDVNEDGTVNGTDIQEVINIIVEGK